MAINLNNAEFIKSAATPAGFLNVQEPCVVVSGKSNVGKSSVINRILVENEYLDSMKADKLNPVLIDPDLKNIMIQKRDTACLAAFNCFEEV